MTTQQTAVQRYRRPRGQYSKCRDTEPIAKQLPECLEAQEVDALIRAAPNPRASLLFLVQWRAGLRVSEALALEVRDLSLDSGLPTIHVRRGKGAKPRIVPVHPELHSALSSLLQFGNIAQDDRLIKASRSTADRWIRAARIKAEESRSNTGGAAHFESYLETFVCPAPAGERDTNQLPVALAGTLVDTDDADILGACAGPDWESCVSTVIKASEHSHHNSYIQSSILYT